MRWGCSQGCCPPERPPAPPCHFDLLCLLPYTSSSRRSGAAGVAARSTCGRVSSKGTDQQWLFSRRAQWPPASAEGGVLLLSTPGGVTAHISEPLFPAQDAPTSPRGSGPRSAGGCGTRPRGQLCGQHCQGQAPPGHGLRFPLGFIPIVDHFFSSFISTWALNYNFFLSKTTDFILFPFRSVF